MSLTHCHPVKQRWPWCSRCPADVPVQGDAGDSRPAVDVFVVQGVLGWSGVVHVPGFLQVLVDDAIGDVDCFSPPERCVPPCIAWFSKAAIRPCSKPRRDAQTMTRDIGGMHWEIARELPLSCRKVEKPYIRRRRNGGAQRTAVRSDPPADPGQLTGIL